MSIDSDHDIEWLRKTRPVWQKEMDRIIDSRGAANGLLPMERYCGDIGTPGTVPLCCGGPLDRTVGRGFEACRLE